MYSLLIFLLYGGGIACAFLFLLIATLTWKSESRRRFLYVLSFLALVTQTGCWHVAIAIGNGGNDFGMDKYVIFAGAALCVWAFILELFWTRHQAKKKRDANGNSVDDYGRSTDR